MENLLQVVSQDYFKNKVYENLDFIRQNLNLLQPTLTNALKAVGFDDEEAEVIVEMYVKFLAVSKSLKDNNIKFKLIPNAPIITGWHAHILNLEMYEKDCVKIFGSYFPHQVPVNKKAIELSNEIWKQVFGQNLYNEINS